MCEALQEVLRASYNEGAADEKKKWIEVEKKRIEAEKLNAVYLSQIAELKAQLAMQKY